MIMYFRLHENFGEPAPIPESHLFPNIRAKRPDLYPLAAQARQEIAKLKWFEDVYRPLSQATDNAKLALDSSDQVIVIPEQATLENLLGPKIVKAALKGIGKSLIKELTRQEAANFGQSLARIVGILDFLLKLKTALGREDGIRLVSEQAKSRRDEAYRHKLRFFIRLRNAQLTPQDDPVRRDGRTWDAFWAYKKAEAELWKYQDMEKNLAAGADPHQRRYPQMKAR